MLRAAVCLAKLPLLQLDVFMVRDNLWLRHLKISLRQVLIKIKPKTLPCPQVGLTEYDFQLKLRNPGNLF